MSRLLRILKSPAAILAVLLLLLLQSASLGWVLTLPRQEEGLAEVIAKARPATVSILIDAAARSRPRLEGQRAMANPEDLLLGGTGFIIDPEGLVVTNLHTIQGATVLVVRLADGRELPARIVGSDQRSDLALLRVAADGSLPSLAFAASDETGVGDRVIALGDPFGYEGSATLGIVSALERAYGSVDPIGYLQHDAAINPGSSGGPLLNAAGAVVGVNTAIADEAPFHIGIGLAIPAERARAILTALLEDGQVRRGFAGISLQTLDTSLRDALRLPPEASVIVTAVQEDSPAAEAGLVAGDVVTEVGGRAVRQLRDINGALLDSDPGDRLTFGLLREGRALSATVTLAEAPPESTPAGHDEAADWRAGGAEGGPGRPELDLVFADEIRSRGSDPGEQAGLPPTAIHGVEPGSFAASLGLSEGDVIRSVGPHAVGSSTEVHALLAENEGPLALLVERPGQGSAYLLVPDAPSGFGNKVPSGNHGSVSAGPF